MISMLLVALALGLVLSVVCCAVALGVFPWFRSGERKPGAFRPDQSTGKSSAVVVARRGKRGGIARSSELPLVGGAAMIVAIVLAVIITVILLNTINFAHTPINFGQSQWELLGVLLGATVAYGAVGFLDDWMKVHRGQGVSELTKLAGVMVVSLFAAIGLNRLVPSARFAYAPYADIPGLGNLLVHTHYAWLVFFVVLTITVGSTTSLAVDFTDGLDGLAGGVLVSAALAFAVIIVSQTAALSQTPAMNQTTSLNWPSVLIMLAMVGALVGFLPFNWPSSYRANGQGRGRRRARLIMGDTGSLALGGALALVAIITRLELLLIYIGGVFVLEGVSALISARILVKFFRQFLTLLRFGSARGFAHTEFPLPFLATPMHHHYELLNFDRQRLVYGAWTLGAVLAVLGVASADAPFTWERYLARLVALGVILFVWQLGPSTRSFFIGTVPNTASASGARQLGLFYGYPYLLFGFRLFGRVDTVEVAEDTLKSLSERLSMWQRMSVFDARTILGFYCYRAGYYRDAVRIWDRIPDVNVQVRPMIADLLLDARHHAALDGEVNLPDLFSAAPNSTPLFPAPPAGEPWGAFVHPEFASAQPFADNAADRQAVANPALHAPRLEPAANLDWSLDAGAGGAGTTGWGGNGWHTPFGGPNPRTQPSTQDPGAPDR